MTLTMREDCVCSTRQPLARQLSAHTQRCCKSPVRVRVGVGVRVRVRVRV